MKDLDQGQKAWDQPYEEVVSKYPSVSKICSPQTWEYLGVLNRKTAGYFNEKWVNNIKENAPLFEKHGSVLDGLEGLGFNKAVIGIGAGPSYNLNKHVLKRLNIGTWARRPEDQDFLFIASNHQLKTCLKDGIYPHFVMLCDSGDVVMPQLCAEIPSSARNVVLITTVAASPKVLKEWDRQGRAILFYVPKGEAEQDAFREATGINPAPHVLIQGGNVLNTMWILSLKFLKSTVFMCVGNDLSFPYTPNLRMRRRFYYADGDYSSNYENQRDEAKSKFAWMGFSHSKLESSGRALCLQLFGTAHTLWNYKTWLEVQVSANAEMKVKFHYYNCSEQGILGIIPRDWDSSNFFDKDNWQLLDSLAGNRYHTMKLLDAAGEFLAAKAMLESKGGIVHAKDEVPLVRQFCRA